MTQILDLGKLRYNWLGAYNVATEYESNDVVAYGGGTYVYINAVKSTGSLPTNATYWALMVDGVNWRGAWVTATPYLPGDLVFSGLSTYITDQAFTSGATFAADYAAGKWDFFAKGAADILPPITPADKGYSVSVNQAGALEWLNASGSTDVFYVSPDGNDANPGTSLALPFASIQAAVAAASAGNATIFVKTGSYYELSLPIIVPANTAIVGDNQRTVNVYPGAGLAHDGVTPNAESLMFAMSNGSILNKMTFKGMTGWEPGSTPNDITTSDIKGVVIGFNPASPITTKSPYVLECSAICSGAVGAFVDGTVHSTGFKSMLFHGYTIISDLGVGYYVKDQGKAEIVSCFTYYCYFGYATTGGGFIRALNGNNSYGHWGVTSSGFDSLEVPITGVLYGDQIQTTTDPINVGFTAGSTITGQTSGATGVITNLQSSAGKVYFKYLPGSPVFTPGETFNDGAGNTLVIATGGVTGQDGVLLVVSGLTASPIAGASVQIAGDAYSYVIQSVSGTWVDANSILFITLAQQKPNPSPSGSAVTLRYKYSQIRLTGHDFLNIGTGGIATTNYPNTPLIPPAQGNEVDETYPGRVYYVSTDQDGNFRVGEYFKIDQGTGTATLNASAFNLSGLTSLRLGSIGAQLGEQINEFSSDATLGGSNPTNLAVPTEFAVKTYVDNAVNPIAAPQSFANNSLQLWTDGVNSYWQSPTIVTGENTFSRLVNTAGYTSTYTATSLTTVSPTFTYSVNYPSLPAGITAISINSTTGVLTFTGTFTATGTYRYSVDASDGKYIGRLACTIYVGTTVVIPSFTSLPTVTSLAIPGSSTTVTSFQATNTGGGITYAIVSGGYPSWMTFNTSTGAFTGIAPNFTVPTQIYNLTISATAGGITVTKTFKWTFMVNYPTGQTAFTTAGTYSWTAPSGVTSVSVVAVGAGGGGYSSWANPAGNGGGLGWKNSITVVPGTSYTVVVGAGGSYSGATAGGNSYFLSLATVSGYGGGGGNGSDTNGPNKNTLGGGYVGDGGGAGGYAPSYQGGGGAGGYTGQGGNQNQNGAGGGGGGGSYYSSTYGCGAGGGVGILGAGPSGLSGTNRVSTGYGGGGGSGGANGANGEPASAGPNAIAGGAYGGGGGGPGTSYGGGNGGVGAVRIIWGVGRAFPSTLTADQPTVP